MIQMCNDNILVTEVHKDSKAGALVVSQDESSAYMFVKVEAISDGAKFELDFDNINTDLDNILLVVQRTAKLPFIQNKFFVSYKDVIAIIDKKYFEEI